MRKTRFFLIALVVAGLGLPTLASADTTPIEQFWDAGPSVKNVGGYTGVLVEDAFELTTRQSNMTGFYFEKKSNGWVQSEAFSCTEYSDPKCSGADNIWYDAILDVCKSEADTNCVAGVTAIKDGKEIKGKFSQSYPETNKFSFKGDAALNIPDGGLPSLWTFNGLTHQGGDQFMVYPRYFHNGAWYGGEKVPLAPTQFDVGIFAISKAKVANMPEFHVVTQKADATGKAAWWNGANFGCQSTGPQGECALSWPLPKDVRFRLEIRSSIPLSTFMHGRLLDPSIKITTEASGRQLLTIEAGSVSVPVLNTWVKNSDMPKALHDYLYSMTNFGGFYVYQDGQGSSRDNVQLLEHFDVYDARTFQEYLWWLEVAKDKSIGNKTQWIARTLSSGEINSAGQKVSDCLKQTKSLSGIVTTNAGMYVSGPPSFNASTQSLDYKVAAPHFDDKGTPNIGTYNLVISSAVARCVYGFSSAPISATISIVSADGTSQVATTVVREKDGWIYLSAAGYGYSSPTVRVKFAQEAAAEVAAPTPAATAAPTKVQAKVTIACLKGKVLKKVTGVKPTCPTGYKKK
jgi:hypothetical protein